MTRTLRRTCILAVAATAFGAAGPTAAPAAEPDRPTSQPCGVVKLPNDDKNRRATQTRAINTSCGVLRQVVEGYFDCDKKTTQCDSILVPSRAGRFRCKRQNEESEEGDFHRLRCERGRRIVLFNHRESNPKTQA